ncbi:hypothetical protein F4805DRAFT_238630 [Annulohypoxylon moriforme]|nr:hypothetical protein F4805DRAFT_238630 [Annulohypoxylon moriforme]
MRLSLATLLTTGLAFASALVIPPEIPTNDTVLVENHQGVIPISSINCTNYSLNPISVINARHKLADWGLHHKVPGKSMKKARSGEVVWYVCNCKWTHKDGLADSELREAEEALFKQCGDFQSGWVWSHKWDKMYQIEPLEWVERLPETWHWCPHYCVWGEVGSSDVCATCNKTVAEES